MAFVADPAASLSLSSSSSSQAHNDKAQDPKKTLPTGPACSAAMNTKRSISLDDCFQSPEGRGRGVETKILFSSDDSATEFSPLQLKSLLTCVELPGQKRRAKGMKRAKMGLSGSREPSETTGEARSTSHGGGSSPPGDAVDAGKKEETRGRPSV